MKDFFTRHSHKIVTIVTILLIIGFAYQVMAYLIGQRDKPQLRPQQEAVRHVKATPVEYGTVTASVIAMGRVISQQDVIVSSEVRGVIQTGDIPFKKGQKFKKGDILIKIFNDNAIFDLKAQKSKFLQSIAAILPDMKVDYKERYQDWESFFKSIDLDESLPAMPEIDGNQLKTFLASRNLLSDYYTIKSEEVTLSKYTIQAPFSGTITNVSNEVGSIANPGAALATIIRTERLEIEIPVEVRDARWIRIGDKVIISVGSDGDHWEGNVVRKADFVDPDTQSLSVFVNTATSREKPLLQGQYFSVEFPGIVINNAMEIPRNAVFNHNNVFTVNDDRLAKAEVTIHKINENTLVFSGLPEQTELVVEPLINAFENSRVEIIR